MSQDKDVTPTVLSRLSWIDRSLSMAPVQAYRRQSIKRMHGAIRRTLTRCGCGDLDPGFAKQRRAVVYGLIEPVEMVPEVLLSTECRIAPVLWVLLIPDGGLFSWCEIVELTDEESIAPFFEPSAMRGVRSRQSWETMATNEMRLKILLKRKILGGDWIVQPRASVIREIMSGYGNISHINFSMDCNLASSLEPLNSSKFQLNEFDVDFLRNRYIPQWRQSGDMAYREFNTYTITRKVDRPLENG
ncbi:MAG: hypothetical protein RJB13_419 [Pseudomonadota bacterium]